MREADFKLLTAKLLDAGIAPRFAYRAVRELRDHRDDLITGAMENGMSRQAALDSAAERLGSVDEFVRQMSSRRELKTWAFRYPRLAVVVYPLACLAALPAMPVMAGVAHRLTLARWGASLFAAGIVTAALMLAMQLSILFG